MSDETHQKLLGLTAEVSVATSRLRRTFLVSAVMVSLALLVSGAVRTCEGRSAQALERRVERLEHKLDAR